MWGAGNGAEHSGWAGPTQTQVLILFCSCQVPGDVDQPPLSITLRRNKGTPQTGRTTHTRGVMGCVPRLTSTHSAQLRGFRFRPVLAQAGSPPPPPKAASTFALHGQGKRCMTPALRLLKGPRSCHQLLGKAPPGGSSPRRSRLPASPPPASPSCFTGEDDTSGCPGLHEKISSHVAQTTA